MSAIENSVANGIKRGKKSELARRENRAGFAFAAPQLIGLVCFVLVPFSFAIYLCFTEWNFIKPPVFVGLRNFYDVFVGDIEIFSKTLVNTGVFLMGIVPLALICALSLALLSNQKMRFLNFFKATYFLPMVTSSVSIALVWYWLYAPNYGLINFGLEMLFGIKNGPGWLRDPKWARVAIIIMTSWSKIGYYYIILLAGLKGIDQSYYEAAEVDGANAWQNFWHVTIPMLSPVLFFAIVMLCIDVFNQFSDAFVLTRGGPAYSTYSLIMYIYFKAFQYFRMGEAAVATMVLFLIAGTTTFIQFQLQKKVVNYDV